MTQLSPANQRLNQLLRGIPAKLETRLKELLYGIHKHRPGELTTALKTIAALEYRLFLTQDPQKLAVAETWGLLLHEAYENDPEGTADCFHVLLPEARRFFSECDDLPAIYDHLTFLFHGAERFLRTTLNDSAGPNGYQDLEPVFSEVIRTLAAAARSRSFPAWARAEHLNFSWPDLFASWRTHQTHLLLQRRPLPFWDLVWLQLELVTAHPLLKIECSSLPQLLILARQAFFLQTPHKPDRMEIRLQDVASRAEGETRQFLDEIIDQYKRGSFRGFSDSPPAGETSLTVEYVFRVALIEIMGDGVITSSEEQTIQDLRSYLGISEARYQSIFQEISEAKMARRAPQLERDFDAEEFFYRILRKAVEDGTVTAAEKQILVQVCNALLLDREVYTKAMTRVVQERRKPELAMLDGTECVSTDLAMLLQHFLLAARVKAAVLDEASHAILESVRASLRQERAKAASDFDVLPDHEEGSGKVVAGFFHVPALCSVPLCCCFVDTDRFHFFRRQLAGEKLLVHVTGDRTALVLHNLGLERSLTVPCITSADNVQSLFSAAGSDHPSFLLVALHMPSLVPFHLSSHSGIPDTTGMLDQAGQHYAAGKFETGTAVLRELRQRHPGLPFVSWRLGQGYRLLAEQGIEPVTNLMKAREAQNVELSLNPHFPNALVELARLALLEKKPADALPFAGQAVQFAPGHLAGLSVLLHSFLAVSAFPCRINTAMPADPVSLLGRMNDIFPGHPLFLSALAAFRELVPAKSFGIDGSKAENHGLRAIFPDWSEREIKYVALDSFFQ